MLDGPLRGLGGIASPDHRLTQQRLHEQWQAATRETSARLALACWREQLLPGELAGDLLQLDLAGGRVELPLRRRGPFGLHALALDHAVLDDPLALVEQLCDAVRLDPVARARVRAEVIDSIANLALARLARLLRDALARAEPHATDPRLHDPEHFVTDGHPWHPMTRSRVGLHRAEVVRHAADLLAGARVQCVDITADLVRIGGDWSLASRWFGEPARGFVRVPVHPTALARLRTTWPELLARGSIRLVDRPALPCRSLLSLRTLVLSDDMHLKLAAPMHTTSARRGVSPMSVSNGAVVSRLIADIQREDPITASLQLMPEPAAAGLEPARVGGRASELGAILRVVGETPSGGRAWVCAAMAERWPGTDELVLERACAGYPGGRAQRLAALLDDWIAMLVPAALRLFVVHGVALELHTQNTLAVIVDGRLHGLRVRDLGGIRIHGPRLRRRAAQPSFAEGSFIVTDDLDEVRGKLEHTLFHAHLGSLFAAAAALGFDEARGWAAVRETLELCKTQWANEPDRDAGWRRQMTDDLEAMTRPRVRAKALLRMRLDERSSDYEYTWVDNQLWCMVGRDTD